MLGAVSTEVKPIQSGRKLIRLIHSSASVANHINSKSSVTLATVRCWGTTNKPGLVSVAMNSAKCLGMDF